jgi:hypothetical protein
MYIKITADTCGHREEIGSIHEVIHIYDHTSFVDINSTDYGYGNDEGFVAITREDHIEVPKPATSLSKYIMSN